MHLRNTMESLHQQDTRTMANQGTSTLQMLGTDSVDTMEHNPQHHMPTTTSTSTTTINTIITSMDNTHQQHLNRQLRLPLRDTQPTQLLSRAIQMSNLAIVHKLDSN